MAKKRVSVRSYQRKSKSGKIVTVKQHKQNRDVLGDILRALGGGPPTASKSGEFANGRSVPDTPKIAQARIKTVTAKTAAAKKAAGAKPSAPPARGRRSPGAVDSATERVQKALPGVKKPDAPRSANDNPSAKGLKPSAPKAAAAAAAGKPDARGAGAYDEITRDSLSNPDTPRTRAVSPEEFQSLAADGESRLDALRGTPSDPEGLTKPAVQKAAWESVQADWGGQTIDSHTGKPYDKNTGYAMTVKEPDQESVAIPIGSSREEFDRAWEEALTTFDAQLAFENHHLGVFRNEDTGNIEFDPVIVVDSTDDVESIGAYTKAVGGAYNMADGNGYWPPYVDPSLSGGGADAPDPKDSQPLDAPSMGRDEDIAFIDGEPMNLREVSDRNLDYLRTQLENEPSKADSMADLFKVNDEIDRRRQAGDGPLNDNGEAPAEPIPTDPDVLDRLAGISITGRPDGTGTLADPIAVGGDLDRAVQLIAEGKHVRLEKVDEVSMVLDKLAARVEHANRLGDKAPNYNLCLITVPGTNLFCHENRGIERVNMPQFSGEPEPGSRAMGFINAKGEANIEPAFRQALIDMGVPTQLKTVKASHLKASQNELVGAKVAGMTQAMAAGKIPDAPIFVTKDGYIVDGHHRWAAKVGVDTKDGSLGDIDMPVEEIDLDIGAVLDFANEFALAMGIKPKGTGDAAEGVSTNTGDVDWDARVENLDAANWLNRRRAASQQPDQDRAAEPASPVDVAAQRVNSALGRTPNPDYDPDARAGTSDSFEDVEDDDLNYPTNYPKVEPPTPSTGPITAPDVLDRYNGISVTGRAEGSGTMADPIAVGGDLERAVTLIAEGKHVRLEQMDEVSMVLDRLAARVEHAKKLGEKAPNFNLCLITVPGTNLFCTESKGVPRAKMPQLSGTPEPGSRAMGFVNEKGEANIEAAFRQSLIDMGIPVTLQTVQASHLKASQAELDGPKVAGMSAAMEKGLVKDAPIFVTKDGYIVDGHHRWASKVAIDVKDGSLGDIEMPVEVIDLDIGAVLDFANEFALAMGIKPKGLGSASEGVSSDSADVVDWDARIEQLDAATWLTRRREAAAKLGNTDWMDDLTR